MLAGISYPFALVWLRADERTNLGRHLADQSAYQSRRTKVWLAPVTLISTPCGGRIAIGCEDPSAKVVGFAGLFDLISNTFDLQSLVEPCGHAFDHIGNQSPVKAVQGAMIFGIGGPSKNRLIVFNFHGDFIMDFL